MAQGFIVGGSEGVEGSYSDLAIGEGHLFRHSRISHYLGELLRPASLAHYGNLWEYEPLILGSDEV